MGGFRILRYNCFMNSISIKKLTKRFEGVSALNSLSLSIEKGKTTSIIGPNGSGKTTLINTLTGIVPADEGLIVISGIKLKTIKPHNVANRGITRTFQTIRLFEQMTVLDNILVVLTERKVWGALFERHGDRHLKQAEEVLKKVDLWKKRDALAINLSYGQRKLLEIARALSMDVDTYLFDEPFAGLFPEMRRIVSKVIMGLKNAGRTIVLIEHNMDVIRELSDHVVVLDAGELLAEGKPDEVLAKKEVIEAYLGE